MDPEIRKALDSILAIMPDGSTDEDAIGWAIQSHAHCIDNHMLVMTHDDLHAAMIAYATHAVAAALGEPVRPVSFEDGSIGFEKTGESSTERTGAVH